MFQSLVLNTALDVISIMAAARRCKTLATVLMVRGSKLCATCGISYQAIGHELSELNCRALIKMPTDAKAATHAS